MMFPITQFKERDLKGIVVKQTTLSSMAVIMKLQRSISIALISLNRAEK